MTLQAALRSLERHGEPALERLWKRPWTASLSLPATRRRDRTALRIRTRRASSWQAKRRERDPETVAFAVARVGWRC
jgi:hypothetical protein